MEKQLMGESLQAPVEIPPGLDILQEMLDRQLIFQQRLAHWRDGNITSRLVDNIDGLIGEASEAKDWLAWKKWKRNYLTEPTPENLLECEGEVIDALHFVLNCCVALGLNSKDVYTRYVNKNGINHDRQDNGY